MTDKHLETNFQEAMMRINSVARSRNADRSNDESEAKALDFELKKLDVCRDDGYNASAAWAVIMCTCLSVLRRTYAALAADLQQGARMAFAATRAESGYSIVAWNKAGGQDLGMGQITPQRHEELLRPGRWPLRVKIDNPFTEDMKQIIPMHKYLLCPVTSAYVLICEWTLASMAFRSVCGRGPLSGKLEPTVQSMDMIDRLARFWPGGSATLPVPFKEMALKVGAERSLRMRSDGNIEMLLWPSGVRKQLVESVSQTGPGRKATAIFMPISSSRASGAPGDIIGKYMYAKANREYDHERIYNATRQVLAKVGR